MQESPVTGLLSLPTELLTLIGDYLLETPDDGDNPAFPPTARKRARGHSDLGSLDCTSCHFCTVFTPLLDHLASTKREYGVVAFHWSVAIRNIRLVRLLMENALDITVFVAEPYRRQQKFYGLPDEPYNDETLAKVLNAGPRIHVCEGSQSLKALGKEYRVMVGPRLSGDFLYSFGKLRANRGESCVDREDSICSFRRMMMHGQERLIGRMFDHGAREIEKGAAFVHAIEFNHYEVVKKMLEHEVDPRGCRYWRFSPMYVAMQMRHAKIVELLSEAGADMAVCIGDNTITALHVAAALGYVKGLKMLISRFQEKGLSLDILDYQGKLALVWAKDQGWKECVQSLEQAGTTAIGAQ
ncbi:ankyrin [Morchella conica CCBAS932]|uniref:Ankyrin n=1 Tax=Morchella conica CCBAS932 TaxID=1392247 RepID=A0A3N4KN59_9PEZI|nr:ankyrin [Morchella conica CCBAS932]